MTHEPRRHFRLPFSRATLQRDIDEELAFHLESRTADLVAAGSTLADAKEVAMREFGDVTEARTDLRRLGRRRLRRLGFAAAVDALREDARHAVRGAAREPGFAAAVVLTLALGVGANAAMFGVADQLLLRAPAGVSDPQAVVRIGFDQRNRATGEVRPVAATTYRTYDALRTELSGSIELAAFLTSAERSLGRGEQARSTRVASATHTFFDVLGVSPALGRFFTAEEDTPPQGADVAVISHDFWQRHFGGAVDALGRTLDIDRSTFTVIGVTPRGFNGLDAQRVDVWLPVSVAGYDTGSPQWHLEHNIWWLRIVGRVAPGASLEAIAERATAVDAREHPERYARDDAARVSAGPLVGARAIGASPEQERANRVSIWLLGVSGVVLLIACANVANLLLARALRRRRETGVRVALGVGRVRLVAQVFTEIFVLALAGGALGLVLAGWTGPLIRTVLLPEIHWPDGAVDGRVLVFSLVAVLGAGLLAGIAPALHTARADVAGLIRSGGRGATGRRSRTRGALVIAQGALCVLLLVGAGLFVRSLRNAQATDLGFDAARAVTVDLNSWAADLPAERRRALDDLALERLAALPGVEAAALAISEPFRMRLGTSFHVPGVDSIPRGADGGPYVAYVDPGYFRAMGLAIERGRGFRADDDASAERVVVLTATLARELFAGADPIGECLYFGTEAGTPCTRVVGVASDVRFISVDAPPTLQLFIPLAQTTNRSSRLIVLRTAGPPRPLLARIGETAQALHPALPLVRVKVIQELADPQIRPWRMGATLFSAFGALALLLAALGLYSVIAYDVAQRRQELGVRIALGAGAAQLRRMVFRDAGRLAVPGVALGLAAAFALAGRLEPVLYRVEARDPLIFAGVAAVLLAVGAAAALRPAVRATRVDPLEAMRAE